jgi:malonate decarboxylase alpha subunit
MNAPQSREWDSLRQSRNHRLERAASLGLGQVVPAGRISELLEAVIQPGDRVCLEGNNQKQADFLARCLTQLDPAQIHHLHMLQSVLALPEHLDIFDIGIASKLDFSFRARKLRAWPTWCLPGKSRLVPFTPTWSCSAVILSI